MGGLTPARKVTALGELHGVRTACHGPSDVSLVGHALNLHLDLVAPNFGIQEYCGFDDPIQQVFSGMPELRQGYLYPNDRPGLGINVNEERAATFPCQACVDTSMEARLADGSLSRP